MYNINTNGCPNRQEDAITNNERCPVCNNSGEPVSKITVEHLVIERDRISVDGDDYKICMDENCDVVYYNTVSKNKFLKNQVTVPIWFKKDANPKYACYCSRVTEEQVKVAVIKYGAKTVKEVNEITGAMENANCKENNPLGVCCHNIIQGIINCACGSKKED